MREKLSISVYIKLKKLVKKKRKVVYKIFLEKYITL